MDFRYSQEQLDLIEAAKAIFQGENSLERMRSIVANPELLYKDNNSLWPQLVELGLIGLMAPESCGGLQQPLEVMTAVAEEAGYVALAEPLIELAGIAVPLLNHQQDHSTLSEIVNGEKSCGVISKLQS